MTKNLIIVKENKTGNIVDSVIFDRVGSYEDQSRTMYEQYKKLRSKYPRPKYELVQGINAESVEEFLEVFPEYTPPYHEWN